MSPSMTTSRWLLQMRADEKRESAVGLRGDGAIRSGVTVKTTVDRQWQRLSLQGLLATCKALGIKHTHPAPIGPRPTGKAAERFIQTRLREWAFFTAGVEQQRRAHRLAAVLPGLLQHPQTAFGLGPPALQLPGSVGRTYCNLTTSAPIHAGPHGDQHHPSFATPGDLDTSFGGTGKSSLPSAAATTLPALSRYNPMARSSWWDTVPMRIMRISA